MKMWLKPFSVIKNNSSNFIVGIVLFSCFEWLLMVLTANGCQLVIFRDTGILLVFFFNMGLGNLPLLIIWLLGLEYWNGIAYITFKKILPYCKLCSSRYKVKYAPHQPFHKYLTIGVIFALISSCISPFFNLIFLMVYPPFDEPDKQIPSFLGLYFTCAVISGLLYGVICFLMNKYKVVNKQPHIIDNRK